MWIDERVPRPAPRHTIRIDMTDTMVQRCSTCRRPVNWTAFRKRDGTLVSFIRHYDEPDKARAAGSHATGALA
jgi:hypothetical protein